MFNTKQMPRYKRKSTAPVAPRLFLKNPVGSKEWIREQMDRFNKSRSISVLTSLSK